jgi:hypothetical protein
LPDCVDKEHKGGACVPLSCRKNRKTCPSKTHQVRTRSRIVIRLRLRLLSRPLPRLGETFRSRTRRRQHRQCNGRAVCYCSDMVLTGMPALMPSIGAPYIYVSETAHSSTSPHQFARPSQTDFLPFLACGFVPCIRRQGVGCPCHIAIFIFGRLAAFADFRIDACREKYGTTESIWR